MGGGRRQRKRQEKEMDLYSVKSSSETGRCASTEKICAFSTDVSFEKVKCVLLMENSHREIRWPRNFTALYSHQSWFLVDADCAWRVNTCV